MELKFYEAKKNGTLAEFSETYERKEKIKMLDEATDGKFSRFLTAVSKWEEEKDALPHDYYNYVKTVSLKGWINRNKVKDIFGYEWSVGETCFFGANYYLNSKRETPLEGGHWHTWKSDTFPNYIDEVFYCYLEDLANKEENYFLHNDPFECKKRRVEENCGRFDWFGKHIAISSSEGILVYEDDEHYHKITEVECDELIAKMDKVEALIKELSE